MFKKLSAVLCILIAGVSLSYAGAGPNIHEGNWEITSTMEMPGMAGSAAPMKYAQCLTSKDAVPKNPETVKGCTITSMKAEGNTVTWVMRCSEQGAAIDGNGSITYSSDTMQGTIKMTLHDPEGGTMEMVQRLSGQRIGDCKK